MLIVPQLDSQFLHQQPCVEKLAPPVDIDFLNVVSEFMRDNNIIFPTCARDALLLYVELVHLCEQMDDWLINHEISEHACMDIHLINIVIALEKWTVNQIGSWLVRVWVASS